MTRLGSAQARLGFANTTRRPAVRSQMGRRRGAAPTDAAAVPRAPPPTPAVMSELASSTHFSASELVILSQRFADLDSDGDGLVDADEVCAMGEVGFVAHPTAHGTALLLFRVQEGAARAGPLLAHRGAEDGAHDARGLAAKQMELEVLRWHRRAAAWAAALQRKARLTLHGARREGSRSTKRPTCPRPSQVQKRTVPLLRKANIAQHLPYPPRTPRSCPYARPALLAHPLGSGARERLYWQLPSR